MMLQLSGHVWNVFQTDRKTDKEGKEYGGDWKVQLMADIPLENGTFRTDIVDLKTSDHSAFKQHEKQQVAVPVGCFSPAKGQVIFFQSGKPIFPASSNRGKPSE